MSDPILGQDEVNALLDAIKMGGLNEEEAERDPSIKAYDLTSNHRVVRGRMPALEIINDRQARLHRGSLSTIARRVVDVSYRSSSLIRFGEVQSNMPAPTCISVVQLAPLNGFAAVAFDTGFLYSILDILFGGSGMNESKRVSGDLTAVEVRLARRLVDAILADMEGAWSPILRLRGEFVRTESNPRFVTIAAPGDVMVEIVYDLEIESLMSGTISVLIPYSSLQPYKNRLSSIMASDDDDSEKKEWERCIHEKVLETQLELVGILGTTRMQLSDILNLEPGDVVKLSTNASGPISLQTDGVQVAKGHPEVSGGNTALRLTSPVAGPRWRKKMFRIN
ncbi:MAG: flagellar motor switch protein FliM [Myxococcota bacterium]|nr:flagellar motor switch protein FliM [Myxococcota bacterium]